MKNHRTITDQLRAIIGSSGKSLGVMESHRKSEISLLIIGVHSKSLAAAIHRRRQRRRLDDDGGDAITTAATRRDR